MRLLLIAFALSVSIAAEVGAGELHARIEGPASDGVTYTARIIGSDENTTLEPWALAEGVIGGKRQSWLLRPKPTGESGVYQFTREWPEDGQWMIRFCLGHPPAPATVATLRANGSVKNNKRYHQTDGQKECSQALKKFVVRPAELMGPPDPNAEDDC